MGSSLHNKIYLGRSASFLASRKMQGALALATCVAVALAWLAFQKLK